jgi:hypothetical protein
LLKFVFSTNRPIEQNKWRSGSAPVSVLQIGDISAKNEANQCTFALCLAKLHITLANPPLAAFTRLARHCFGRLHQAFHRHGWVSVETRLFGDAESALMATQTILINFFNATKSWVRSIYSAL